jgi:hypothetical protein
MVVLPLAEDCNRAAVDRLSKRPSGQFASGQRVVPTGAARRTSLGRIAVFRVWAGSDPTEWTTRDGDLGTSARTRLAQDAAYWPQHEVESPRVGARMKMTLRHNRGGPGANYYFA